MKLSILTYTIIFFVHIHQAHSAVGTAEAEVNPGMPLCQLNKEFQYKYQLKCNNSKEFPGRCWSDGDAHDPETEWSIPGKCVRRYCYELEDELFVMTETYVLNRKQHRAYI